MSNSQSKRTTMLKMTTMTRIPRLKLRSRDNSRPSKKLNRRKRNKPPKRRQRNKSLKMKKNNATRIKPRSKPKKTRRREKGVIKRRILRQLLRLKTRMTMLS